MGSSNTMNALILLSSIILGSQAFPQQSVRSRCPPKPPTLKEFNATEYLGEWYEQRRFPAFFQLNTRCVMARYGAMDNGRVSVHNVATKQNGQLDEIDGSAYVPDPNYPAELKVEFPGNPSGDYWILDTDYTNYSVVYACQDFLGVIKLEFAWILSREQHLDPELLEYATNVYVNNGIDTSLLEDTLQNDECNYGQ